MSAFEIFQTILRQGKTTTDEALKLFDELDTVDLESIEVYPIVKTKIEQN